MPRAKIVEGKMGQKNIDDAVKDQDVNCQEIFRMLYIKGLSTFF